MANDPDALFPSGPTTRRGLLSAFSRRAAEALPDLPDIPSLAGRSRAAAAERSLPRGAARLDRPCPLRRGSRRRDQGHDGRSRHAHLVARAERLPGADVEGEHPARPVPLRLAERDERRDGRAARAHHGTRRRAGEHSPSSTSSPRATPTSTISTRARSPTCSRAMPRSSAPPAARSSRPSAPAGAPDVALQVGELATFAGFQIEAVPAYHDDAPEAVGYVVRNGTYAFYHAGDTRRVQGIAEAVGRVRRRRRVRADQRQAREHGRHRRRPARVRGRRDDRDSVPLRDVPAQHRQHLALRRRVRAARARSTACRGQASGSRSTTGSSRGG